LDKNPGRERFEQDRLNNSRDKDKSAREETQLRSRLDSILYFSDLWTTVGYQKFFTVWNSNTRDGFTKPRRKFPDPDMDPPPVESRFPTRPEEIKYLKHT